MHKHEFTEVIVAMVQPRSRRTAAGLSGDDDEMIAQLATVRRCRCGLPSTERREIPWALWVAELAEATDRPGA